MKNKLLLILLLTATVNSFAQQVKFQRELDSIKRAFWHADSLRRMHQPKDTVKNILFSSPFVEVYREAKPAILGLHQLQMQLVRFRHEYFLNIVLKGGFVKAVVVAPRSGLEMTMGDGNVIQTFSLGRAAPRGTAERNSSDLHLIYGLTEADARLIKAGVIKRLKITHDSGQWAVAVPPENAVRFNSAIKPI